MHPRDSMTWSGVECCASVAILDKVPLFSGSIFEVPTLLTLGRACQRLATISRLVLAVFRDCGCRSASTTTLVLFLPGGMLGMVVGDRG